jgi:ribosomal protein S18 acetylase RimI-like enzyme
MTVRRAVTNDIDRLIDLLCQVLDVHHNARPDIFRAGATKYTESELTEILKDDQRPIFVCEDDEHGICGYVFCVFVQHKDNNILTDIKTLYIDDLCVDSKFRGKGIGKVLYNYAVDFAKSNGCYNLTLNVWADNTSALGFYESLGLHKQKIGMEKIL